MFRASKMFSSPFSRSSIFIPKVNSLISIASASFRLESHQLRNTCVAFQTSGFHCSAYVAAKKTKVVAGEGVVVADIVLPDTKLMDAQMEKKMVRIIDDFMKLRSGQVNTEVFRSVMVDSGGSRLSVADSGQISVKSPTKMSISVFDPSLVVLVADAIRDSGMGLNPTVEGNSVLMSMPKPSKEAKEALVRSARIIADRGKQDVRQVRKEAIDHVKKLKGSVSDDHLKRYTKDIETVMEKKIEKIVKILKDKEVELMK